MNSSPSCVLRKSEPPTDRKTQEGEEILDEFLDSNLWRPILLADERGPVRWPEIPVEGLDCEKDRGPVRWPEIPVEGLDCKASPALHWGRSS